MQPSQVCPENIGWMTRPAKNAMIARIFLQRGVGSIIAGYAVSRLAFVVVIFFQ